MIYDYKLLLSAVEEYNLEHVYQEVNTVDDLFLKHRLLEKTKFNIFYQPPNFSLSTT